ncbi:ABC transporter permease [Phocaeicola sp.]
MIAHYLKIAFRNLIKYKTQSVISILGLATGFVCFALSAYWIHYEMTYDAFHQDANRIYAVRVNDSFAKGKVSSRLPHPIGHYLKEHYPEIEDYSVFNIHKCRLNNNNKWLQVNMASADSTFMQMMNIKVLDGNTNFMIRESQEIAITQDMATQLFGKENPLGKEIELNQKTKKICAVVTGWDEHSSFHYSFIGDINYAIGWDYSMFQALVKLKKNTDVKALLHKMNENFPDEMKRNKYGETGVTTFFLTPLTSLHYDKDFLHSDDVIITFNYIVYFSVAGILIIICALVNYLTLFINRIRARKKEMALRKVNGASDLSLIALLFIEYMMTLVSSIFVGMLLIEVLLPVFIEYSGIISSRPTIYGEALAYIAGISIIASLVAILPIYLFHKRTLQSSLGASKGRHTENLFRKGSIIVQLSVCLFVIFATVTINRQLYFLKHTDLGMVHHNIGSVSIWMNVDMNTWSSKIAALPMVTETLPPKYYPLVSTGAMMMMGINKWDGLDKPVKEPEPLDMILASEDFCKFYGMTLLSGEWISEKSLATDLLITESTARTLGWKIQEAIGKHIYPEGFDESFAVIGIVKDCQYKSPTTKIPNTAFINTEKQKHLWFRASIMFKYKEGTWPECKHLIEKMYQEEYPDKVLRLFSEDEEYDHYLRSENALHKLLEFASIICIIISIFGIYSLVTLTCEQRRKEIAIRKVNGATVKTIIKMFFREYLSLLILSSIIAFPVSYLIMKKWIEGYNRQIEMGCLPFIYIFIGIALIITASIGWRVWKAANENPAEVIKNE